MKSLQQALLEKAAGFRCGLVLPYQIFENTFCQLEDVFNVSVPQEDREGWQTAAGSISRDANQAIMGALGEALERENAARCFFPVTQGKDIDGVRMLTHRDFALFSQAQYDTPGFPWSAPDPMAAYYGESFSLTDDTPCMVPQELIGLGSRAPELPAYTPSTSNGLAAHQTPRKALIGGILELLERDALAVTWLNSLGGRELPLPESYTAPVQKRQGIVRCFDVTQGWNPCPVVIICGYMRKGGRKTISLGCACRFSRTDAVEKAYLEWLQGCIFAGFYAESHPELQLSTPQEVDSFDKHAVYYTLYPEQWEKTPLLRDAAPYIPPEKTAVGSLESLLEALGNAGIEILYRDLSRPDIRRAGLTVVRTLSPQLSLLHGEEIQPFLGGRTDDVRWRYPEMSAGSFPNPYPHPLG